jgi:hypothetical protein
MPGKADRAKVQIKESSNLELKTFEITLTASASDFQVTDLLKSRGVLSGLDLQLKQAVKQALEDYLTAAEELIASLASRSPQMRNTRRRSTDKLTSNGTISPDPN